MRKTVNVLLVIALSQPILNAESLGGIIESANTKASSWSSPTTGKKYFYSGSYNFTFKKAGGYAPWFSAGGSSDLIKSGCNGISIGDMYLSMLGLDEIKDQLKDAGAQIAWGVMMGLVYTMPGIKDVFETLQKWSRAIQALLQSACSIGQNLGKGLAESETMRKIKGKAMDLFPSKTYSYVSGGATKLKKNIDAGLDFFTCADYAKGTSAASYCTKGKTASVADETHKLAAGGGTSSIMTSMIGSAMGEISVSKSTDGIYAGKLSAFLETGELGGLRIITDSQKLSELKTTILMQKLFFGDSGFAEKNLSPLMSLTDCSSAEDAAKKGKCELDLEKMKHKKVKQALAGYTSVISKSISRIPPAITSVKDIADTILYGIKADTVTNKAVESGDGYCNLVDDTLIYIDMTTQAGTDKKSDESIKLFAMIPGTKASAKLRIEWKGAVVESYKSIKYYVKQSNGIEGNIGFYKNNPISSSEKGNIPLVIPGAKRYIDIIAQLEKNADEETPFTASLKELLAKYNAYMFSKSFFDNMLGRIKTQLSDSKSNGIDASSFKKMEDSFTTGRAAVTKEFDAIVKETNNFKDIIEIFEKIDKNSRENSSNILR